MSTTPVKRSIWDAPVEIDKTDFAQVFSACAGWVLNTQLKASELVVKNQPWDMNFELGTIAFGNDQHLIQLIGSVDDSSNTWLWGWANPSELPQVVLESSVMLRHWAQQNGLTLFTQAEHPISETVNGHTLAIVATALEKEPACYYCGKHDGGAVFVTFTGLPNEVFAPIDPQRFATLTSQLISQFTLHHKIFVQSFLYQNNTPFHWQGQMLTANFGPEQDLIFQFDEQGRIADMRFSAQAN